MRQQDATSQLRKLLDEHGLKDWKIHINNDTEKLFLGMCSYRDKTIILHGMHILTHPDVEIIDTIKHEVAHALVGPCGHNEVWRAKAIELGCTNTMPCAVYSFDDEAIDAIRSGATLEIGYEERTEVIRTPTYKVHRLQDTCPTCGKVAKVASKYELNGLIIFRYECGHIETKTTIVTSNYESLVFDGISDCQHQWGTGRERTTCTLCGAHKLYDYQAIGARNIEKYNGRFAVFDDMGLGKTIQALAYMRFNLAQCTPYLWVTKSKIKHQHAYEIVRILGNSAFPQIIDGSKKLFVKGPKGYIISYDLFRKLDLEMLKELNIQCIVLDECQAIKNPDSARTIALREVVKNIPRIIPLSGTFWKNRGSEAFVALNMLDPRMFWSFNDFKRKYVRYVYDDATGKEREGGFRQPEKFRDMIAHIAIRRERKEVMPELPLVTRTKLICEVDDASRKVYNEEVAKIKLLMKDAILEGREGSFEVQSQLQNSIHTMRQIVGIAKVPAVIEYLQDYLEDTDRKIVCFVHHIQVGKLIFEEMTNWCEENNLPKPIQMVGGTSPEASKNIQDTFNDTKCRLLIASTLAAGEGLNLQKTCSDCIIAERQWNPANEEQAEARFIRIGQEADVVNAIYALGEHTVDEELDALVNFKRIEFHNAMNKSQMDSWNEKSLFKAMIDAIVKS